MCCVAVKTALGDGTRVPDEDDRESDGLFTDLLGEDADGSDDGSSEAKDGNQAATSSVAAAGFSDVEYINFGTFTYHLRRNDNDETVCGISLGDAKFKSSTRKPDLLDPCKRCHGLDETASTQEKYKQLRAALAKRVDTVAPAESSSKQFTESELIALSEEIPTEFPDFDPSLETLRYNLSLAVEGIECRAENPGKFTKSELEDLDQALDGDGLIPKQPAVVIATTSGLMKRTPLEEFQPQHRGGKGINHMELATGDTVAWASIIQPRKQVFCFTNVDKVYQLWGHEIPDRHRDDSGVSVEKFLDTEAQELIVDVITGEEIADFEYIIMSTSDGYVKRTSAKEFMNILSTGIQAIDLSDCELIGVSGSSGECDVILTSFEGNSIRFEETELRPMGRPAKGVGGIELESADSLASLAVFESDFDGEVLTVTENGFGKRTPIDGYRRQSRFGKGLLDIETGDRNGPVVATGPVTAENEAILVTNNGRGIRIDAGEISSLGRNTKGVNLIDLDEGDSVAGVTIVPSE
jgi:DNA gyrase subunit A